jgi:hypothetical protein
LALYLQLGLKLKKIHKVLEFEQEKIFEPYIEKTTDARKKAHSKFEMDMFKKLVSHITFTVNRLYSCLLVSNYEFFSEQQCLRQNHAKCQRLHRC